MLVAYVLPKDAKQLAVVSGYHFDFKARRGARQTEAQAAYDERKGNASSSSDDDEHYYGGYRGPIHADYRRNRLAIKHTLGTLGIPVVVPASAPEIKADQSISTKRWSVGGGAQAEDLATRVKRVLEACVPAAAAAQPAAATPTLSL